MENSIRDEARKLFLLICKATSDGRIPFWVYLLLRYTVRTCSITTIHEPCIHSLTRTRVNLPSRYPYEKGNHAFRIYFKIHHSQGTQKHVRVHCSAGRPRSIASLTWWVRMRLIICVRSSNMLAAYKCGTCEHLPGGVYSDTLKAEAAVSYISATCVYRCAVLCTAANIKPRDSAEFRGDRKTLDIQKRDLYPRCSHGYIRCNFR